MNKAQKIRTDIINLLSKIDDVTTLKMIHSQLSKESIPSFMEAVKPIRENISLEQIMAEQNYQPITYKKFRDKTNKLEWTESLDDLLDALKK